jgi:Tol biopolymer transport system component
MLRLIVMLTITLLISLACFAQDDPDLTDLPSSKSPVVSPDGRKILFVSDSGASSDIWIASRNGSEARPLLNWGASEEKDPDWSADGTKVFFASNKGESKFNIWVVSADGSSPQQLTTGSGDNQQPRVSPNGLLVAFTSNRTGKRELWKMKPDGSQQTAIGLIPRRISDPAWSSDSQRLVYVGCSRTACNLFTITADAASFSQVTSGDFQDWFPDWLGNEIVFASDRQGIQGLWIVNSDGSGLRLLTDPGSTGDLYPRWDRLTRTVLFSRAGSVEQKSASNIWATDLSGNAQQLTNVRGLLRNGDVNTDGEVNCIDLNVVRRAIGIDQSDSDSKGDARRELGLGGSPRAGQGSPDTRADVNGDGVINTRDLAIVLRNLKPGAICAQ